MGNDPALAQGVVNHRPAHLRSSGREIIVHHDHVYRSANVADSVTQARSLRDSILHLVLDHQEVDVTVARQLASCGRSEQDDLRRRRDSADQPLSCQLDDLLIGHAGQDTRPHGEILLGSSLTDKLLNCACGVGHVFAMPSQRASADLRASLLQPCPLAVSVDQDTALVQYAFQQQRRAGFDSL